jgi:hypothetical protein
MAKCKVLCREGGEEGAGKRGEVLKGAKGGLLRVKHWIWTDFGGSKLEARGRVAELGGACRYLIKFSCHRLSDNYLVGCDHAALSDYGRRQQQPVGHFLPSMERSVPEQ